MGWSSDARRRRAVWTAACLAAAILVAGCATTRKAAPRARRAPPAQRSVAEAPPAETPTDSAPTAPAAPVQAPTPPELPPEEGLASYYADSLSGNRTASGERYRPDEKTCAHRKHKFGTRLLVTAVHNGKTAVCRVNDRGPYVDGRVVDVSRSVADELGMRKRGVIKVRVEVAVDGAGS